MAKKSVKNIKELAVEAALALAAEKDWSAVTLSAIARRAKIKLADLHDHCEDRYDILAAYGRIIDKKVLEAIGTPDPDLPVRDRLFELLMERFDVLNENRAGAVSIVKSCCTDPKQALVSMPHLCRSMGWMCDAAGLETGGIKGVAKIAGLVALYLKTLRTWADDDSEDMAKTMAELDRNLARACGWAESLGI